MGYIGSFVLEERSIWNSVHEEQKTNMLKERRRINERLSVLGEKGNDIVVCYIYIYGMREKIAWGRPEVLRCL